MLQLRSALAEWFWGADPWGTADWAQIPTLAGGVRGKMEVPSLIPCRYPNSCLTGSSRGQHISGEPKKAPVSSLAQQTFLPSKL